VNRSSSLLLAIGLLMEGIPGAAQAADWATLSALPSPRYAAAAAAMDDKLYVLGGRGADDLADATVWNGTSWSEAAPMLTTRVMGGAASVGNGLFAIGGFNIDGQPIANVERFDAAGNAWSPVASMPAARAGFGAAVVGSNIYVAGGEGDGGIPLAALVRYDSGANSWTTLANLPTPRSGVAAATLDGHVWVMGGLSGGPVANVEVFDPTAGSWSSAPNLPEPLWLPAAATFGGRVWIMGGFDGSFLRSERVYSAGSDGVWRAETSLPEALAASTAGVVGDSLVVASGLDASGLPSMSAYSMAGETPPPPPPPTGVEATVWLTPDHVNSSSNGTWISGYIEPVGGWNVADLVVSSIALDGVPATGPTSLGDSDGDGIVERQVKFSRTALNSRPPGVYSLPLTGHLADGTEVTGTATLTIDGGGKLQKLTRTGRLNAVRIGGGAASISFSLENDAEVTLDVVDLQGRVVGTVAKGYLAAGTYDRSWSIASRTSSGLYFFRLRAAQSQDVVRMSIIR
jgi:Kelch motif